MRISNKSHNKKIKLIAVIGPTSSGKSDLAVHIAKKFNGEVISVDSRQVYRGLTIGSGKITKTEMKGVPHHLLDVADPKKTYTAAQFKEEATKTLRYIVKKRKSSNSCRWNRILPLGSFGRDIFSRCTTKQNTPRFFRETFTERTTVKTYRSRP